MSTVQLKNEMYLTEMCSLIVLLSMYCTDRRVSKTLQIDDILYTYVDTKLIQLMLFVTKSAKINHVSAHTTFMMNKLKNQ